MIALTGLGAGIEGRLSPMTLAVPGTPSARAEAMLRARFGNTVPVAILLRGPRGALDAQGRRLVSSLRATRRIDVLSPWDGAGASRTLRPHPGAVFVLVNYVRPPDRALSVVPLTERLLATDIHGPVHSYLTGVAVIGVALQKATMADTVRAELYALPVLIIVLLLVFRSPVAAAVPLVMGGATVAAGRGLLWLASFLTPVNSLGVAIAAMMALALGVDYALLMVSRVRQELAAGHGHQEAVSIAAGSAGRTIAAAGGTLALTMLAASAVATPGLLGPVAIGVVISGLLSVALALTAMPALLRLLGPRLNRFEVRLPRRRRDDERSRIWSVAERLIAHPAITVPAILAAMLALATPASALRMGPPDAAELPAGSPARVAVRMVERTIGPGWTAPFTIVADAQHGPITTTARLKAIIRWQKQIAATPDVAAVLGPASVAGAQHTLEAAHSELVAAPAHLAGAQRGIAGLRRGLTQADGAVGLLRHGLATAAAGAASLTQGSRSARSGALRIAGRTGAAQAGARRLTAGTRHARSGAARLSAQTGRAANGARQLAHGARQAHSGAERLHRETDRAHRGASVLASETGRASAGAQQVRDGLAEAAGGSSRLASGIDEAAAGAAQLAAADRILAAGAAQLARAMSTLDSTVHTALGPVQALARQLSSWASFIESLQSADGVLRERLAQAIRELQTMGEAGEAGSGVAAGAGRGGGAAAPGGTPGGGAGTAGTPGEAQQRALIIGQLSSLAGLIEEDEGGQIAQIEAAMHEGLHALAALPAQLEALTTALDQLTSGADRVSSGTAESAQGAERLHEALEKLAAGGHKLGGGLQSLSGGAERLTGGMESLHGGSERLAGGLGALSAGSARLANGTGRLASGSRQMRGGLERLHAGDRRLQGGLGRLAGGGERLAGGLGRLSSGEQLLAGGLGRLAGGGERLAGGLSEAHGRSGALAAGLARTRTPLARYAAMLAAYRRDYRVLHADSPHALDSGYLVLSALDGTVSPLREQVSQLVNVNGGGQTARIMVVADSAPNAAATAKLSRRLRAALPALATATASTVQIGQGAQYLLDYKNANTQRVPWLVGALALVAVLTLILILRALPLPVIAVTLNLATIAVALGVLQLLTATHVLGGPGYIDAASGAGIISIMFVLSIDYEVFLLTRMRERWVESRDPEEAIRHGLRHTAGVITGSAAIMTAVFLAFTSADVVPLRQFGVGLTIAVLLDATIVRLVLLPAVMRALGARIWWLPRWLERRLPVLE